MDFARPFTDQSFFLIAGPCVIESREHSHLMAASLRDLAEARGIPFIYKSSFDKANRTSGGSHRGPGMAGGLDILAEVRSRYGVPVLTDVHESDQCGPAAQAVDVLQIPAFLCRQTDLIVAAARTGAAAISFAGGNAGKDISPMTAGKLFTADAAASSEVCV